MEKLLTLIVPSYNMEGYLTKCLDCLIGSADQMGKLEVLVVNDGSKDRTSQIAHDFEMRWPETFRVIDKANGHYGSCINAGLRQATGRFIKILDADDTFSTAVLWECVSYLEDVEYDVDLIVVDHVNVDEDGRETGRMSFNLPTTLNFGFQELLSLRCVIFTPNIIYRRAVLTEMNYSQTEGMLYTDGEWCFKPMSHVRKMSYFARPLYRYFLGRPGQSVSQYGRFAHMQEHLLRDLVTFFVDQKKFVEKECAEYLLRYLSHIASLTYGNYILRADFAAYMTNLKSLDRFVRTVCPECINRLADVTVPSKGLVRFHYLRRYCMHGCLPGWYVRLLRGYMAMRQGLKKWGV